MSVLIPSEVVLENIKFGLPKKQDLGYRKSSLRTENNEPLILQTPPLDLVSGPNDSVEFSINSYNKKPEEFFNLIKSLELYTINSISENSKEWFGREIPSSRIKNMFRSCIYVPEKFNGNFSVKVKKDKRLEIFKNNQKMDSLDGAKKVVAILKISSLLFGKSTSKLDIRVVHIRILEEPKKKLEVDDAVSEFPERDSDLEDDYLEAFSQTPTPPEPETTVSDPPVTETTVSETPVSDPTPTEPPVTETTVSETTEEPQVPEPTPTEPPVSDVKEVKITPEPEPDTKSIAPIDSLKERISYIRKKIRKYSEQGDFEKVEQLACELVQLKNTE